MRGDIDVRRHLQPARELRSTRGGWHDIQLMKHDARSEKTSEARHLKNRFSCRPLSSTPCPGTLLLCLLPLVGPVARAQGRATIPVAAIERATERAPRPGASLLDASLVSNANAGELRAVGGLLERLQSALNARDANALGFFGIAPGLKNTFVPRFKMTHLAVAPGGALARLTFDTAANTAAANTAAANTKGTESGDASAKSAVPGGETELWLERRGENDFTLTDRHWTAPSDAASKLNKAAFDAWNTLPAASLSSGALIDLIAERRGGRWIPLRASNIWTGTLLDAAQLAQTAAQMQSEGGAIPVENGSSDAPRRASFAVDAHRIIAFPNNIFAARKISKNAPARLEFVVNAKMSGREPAPRATALETANVQTAQAKAAQAKAAQTKAAQTKAAAHDLVMAGDRENALRIRFAVREATTSGVTPDATPDDRTPELPRRAWNVAPWIRAQMNRYEDEMAGTAHFLMQNGPRGWVGLDSVWDDDRALPAATEKAARLARAALNDDGYLAAASHRDLARALFTSGVFGEAADEIQKAAALQPDIVTQAQISEFEVLRDSDPQILAVRQIENEIGIGVAKNHPSATIPALRAQWKSKPSVLGALRLSLEYSRLAADSVSSQWLEQAQDLGPQWRQNLSENDRMWINLLEEQLQNRRRVAARKPANIIRSTLFTARINPNDLGATRLLAGLEAAQHTIYADFGIPMSNTEVVLWSNQRDFQRHTGQVSGTDTSEFVTALTLTQLVRTASGPEVLGEEINFYTDPRAASLSTIAHEYGHVAVRHLCRGREVPDWINEGVATVVEGGYEDYLPRVRAAAKKNRLLSMRELQAWQIDSADGERAFLAYSQANSMMDYIKARWGRKALLEMLRQIGEDRAPDDAIKNVMGVTPEQLWLDWRREGIR
jgi:hypothetical protein